MIRVSGAGGKQSSLVMRPGQATSGRNLNDSRHAATAGNRQAGWSMAVRSVYASPVAITRPLEARSVIRKLRKFRHRYMAWNGFGERVCWSGRLNEYRTCVQQITSRPSLTFRQFGVASAPMIPRRMYMMRGPKGRRLGAHDYLVKQIGRRHRRDESRPP
jgi:hypothetical protein